MEHRKMIAALKHFIYGDPTLTSIFSKYMDKNKWKKEESQIVMDTLSDMLLKEEYTSRIAEVFSPLLLEFITRKSKAIFLEISANNCETHEWLCICLSKLIWNNPEIRRYVKMYFEKSKSIFWRYEEEHLRPVKKQKTGVQRPRPDQLLKAAYLFLLYDTSYFKSVWSWTVIVRFLNDVNDLSSQWYAHLCLGQLAGIKEHRLHKNMQTIFKEPEYTVYIKELFEICNVWGIKSLDPKLKDIWFNCQSEKASQDLIEATASVCNVCLNKNESQKVPSSSLICVQSIQVVLHSLALAVSVAEPVLIQGPVGCGKTSLVEHLAMLTGKKHVKDFLKIQLGDHVDSKMLLGAHVCSEIPGQFVWKPGILTKAMIEGRWLLLEDIDSAPMDVVSMLNPVLQSRSIVLPGHPKPIKAAPGFQLFATQRLLNGIQGSYIELRSNADVISKRWRKLTINSLNGSELAEVISAKWKKLEPFISGILSMYSTFSACIHQDSTEEIKSSNTNFFGHGRLTSMRDLFKFCNRISEKFELKSENTGVNVFMNAIDCFSDNIPDPKSRLTAAELLCPNVNLSSTKALYFCQNYKPQIKLHIDGCVVIGRICLPKKPEEVTKIISFKRVNKRPMSTFANTRIATVLLEKVAACIYYKEPVLLVGETGTGKTSIVQHLAELTNRKLTVINMSQQSDSVDLIGGYKPADMIHIIQPIKDEFDCLFPKSMDAKVNAKFLAHVSNCFYNKKFSKLFAVILHAQKNVMKLLANQRNEEREELLNRWTKLGEKVHNFDQQLKQSKPTIAFRFIEGALVKAMREGEWLLLDEINLAEAETLECLAGVLDNDDSLILLERGDSEPVKRHPDFRIFACMNPATDVGKKDLPIGIRSRFTEFFVDEVSDTTDLKILVHEYLKNLDIRGRGNLTRDQAIQKTIDDIVKFYKKIKDSAIAELTDGRGASPHYSLRTLCRALKYGSSNFFLSARRSLYEAFCLSFLTQLDNNSHEIVTKYVTQYLIEGKDSILKQAIPEPKNGAYVNIAGYWILKGDQEPEEKENYIFTETVRRNLRDLARIVCAGRFPVLLQGETSCGKTSLIQYLAKATGNVCVRVNNHEHTDIQEYVGTYTTDEKGNLFFKEGILVEAMRNGYWIILDELNLAPTEVMEALNRVLDDNRELFIAETQEVVQAKNGFMLFATQNPAGSYGGRKVLSRAFRNRFIELHFVDIPDPELKEILAKRCQLPSSYSNKLVSIMRDLQKRRRESHLFAGKLGFITLRDLFRWGERYQYAVDPPAKFYDWDQHLAEEGYLLLAGRVRLPQEAKIIQQSIQKVFKRTVDPDSLFNLSTETPFTTKSILEKIVNTVLTEPLSNIVWTRHMRRLAVLVGKALEFNEPVLLIGNTGCGKTTMCQIFAQIFGKKMYSVNCHMHSESSDFLGGLRPVRDAAKRQIKLFEWVDGPLVNAMIEGCYFLMDEISLADDSVLERLNSVLEPEQKIFLTEKGLDSSTSCEITAKKGFQFFATMNPGGDYGKKELSPALRNRLTEIWCPNNLETKSDIIEFVENNIREEWSNGNFEQFKFGESIADFIEFYCQTSFRKTTSVTARDVLTWLEFINTYAYKGHSPIEGYLHGAFLVFLDSVSTGEFSAYDTNLLKQFENRCCEFLESQVDFSSLPAETTALATLGNDDFSAIPIGVLPEGNKQSFGIGPFHIEFGMPSHEASNTNYDFFAKTPKSNAFKILRAMQLPKPILLEGSPGVGKTSLIEVLAKISGHDLVRINLSEQTDISDLFGADLPVEGGKAGEFAWRDGPLLQALKKNHWILLDELNLASQSVLEGLNACLDHRSEIYISELGYTLKLDKTLIRIFGCMNPHQQGGSRKGLPQSFLNRFTRVNIRRMEASDFRHIVSMIYPQIPQKLVRTMINFNEEITLLVNERKALEFYGSPFEFNLRDILRWCEAVVKNQPEGKYDIGEYVTLLYMDRMKTDAHKNTVYKIYKRCVDCSFHNDDQQLMVKRPLQLRVYANSVQLGYSTISCVGKSAADTSLITVPLGQLPVLESIMKCIEMNWMPILIGSEGSGKTSLIRLLAQLSGHYLHTMSVNSEMDIMELLGGFEQV
ncbi:midasin [Caerostris darwini]|uniref:Midasin n=1 Tax=Caerostris darwini TaxID=1538125 RepID=A0AAV4RVZ9_9ARAC|nr:midasin [Caerostris darwini]